MCASIYIIILCLTDTTNQAHKCGSNCIELAELRRRLQSRDSSNLTGDIHFRVHTHAQLQPPTYTHTHIYALAEKQCTFEMKEIKFSGLQQKYQNYLKLGLLSHTQLLLNPNMHTLFPLFSLSVSGKGEGEGNSCANLLASELMRGKSDKKAFALV